jgi:hypothetical protein
MAFTVLFDPPVKVGVAKIAKGVDKVGTLGRLGAVRLYHALVWVYLYRL